MYATVFKITADKRKKDFQSYKVEFEESNDSYIKISSPFYSYIYEQIDIMRNAGKTNKTA